METEEEPDPEPEVEIEQPRLGSHLDWQIFNLHNTLRLNPSSLI
jgi:hypothetical protein